jgi:hypothetical protein
MAWLLYTRRRRRRRRRRGSIKEGTNEGVSIFSLATLALILRIPLLNQIAVNCADIKNKEL